MSLLEPIEVIESLPWDSTSSVIAVPSVVPPRTMRAALVSHDLGLLVEREERRDFMFLLIQEDSRGWSLRNSNEVSDVGQW